MGGPLGISNFKVLSMRCINLYQKTPGAKAFSFLTLKRKAVGVVQTLRIATVRDRRIFYISQNMSKHWLSNDDVFMQIGVGISVTYV
jgi:hypothetical protein